MLDHMVRSTTRNQAVGVHYTDVDVPVVHKGRPRNRKYAHYVAAHQEPLKYKCPQRADKHAHPAPKPVEQPWPCACGHSYATFHGLMWHVTDPSLPQSEHYPR
jgi:hypothetical protein